LGPKTLPSPPGGAGFLFPGPLTHPQTPRRISPKRGFSLSPLPCRRWKPDPLRSGVCPASRDRRRAPERGFRGGSHHTFRSGSGPPWWADVRRAAGSTHSPPPQLGGPCKIPNHPREAGGSPCPGWGPPCWLGGARSPGPPPTGGAWGWFFFSTSRATLQWPASLPRGRARLPAGTVLWQSSPYPGAGFPFFPRNTPRPGRVLAWVPVPLPRLFFPSSAGPVDPESIYRKSPV